ncbi:hypothetical protein [Gulosibacter sp. 10]|uniref:hypothetical protein n=1 Tax=Gulosibacter sp. 10 TaxID=1255570 RepID=UPI00097EBDBB|nr:hypothetical protein [Gulosibacter sp. 10]SJM57703.1 ATP synthase protein I2 [Gulosibacter sp. 10]
MSIENKEPTSVPVMRSVLRWSVILTVAVAVLGAVIGWFVAEWAGVWSGLIGALLVLLFSGVTALSIILAARFDPIYFVVVILAGWTLKLIVFIGVLAVVRAFDFTHDWMLWGTMLAALLAQLAVDVVVVLRSRQPYASEVELPGPERPE